MCDCGSAKVTVAGYRICTHCDTGCPKQSEGCGQCAKYSSATSRRLNL